MIRSSTNHYKALINDLLGRAKSNENKNVAKVFKLDLSAANSNRIKSAKNPNILSGIFNSFIIFDPDRGTNAPVELTYRINKTSSEYLPARSGTQVTLGQEGFDYLEFFNETTYSRTVLVVAGLDFDFKQNIVELVQSGTAPDVVLSQLKLYDLELPNPTTQTQSVDTPSFTAGSVTVSNTSSIVGFRFIKIYNGHPTQTLSVARNNISSTSPRAEILPYQWKTFLRDESTNNLILTYLNDLTITGTPVTIMKRV